MKRGSRRHGSGEWTIWPIKLLETANLLPPVSRVQASGARSDLVWSFQATRLGIGALDWRKAHSFRPIEAEAGRAPIQRWEIIMSYSSRAM